MISYAAKQKEKRSSLYDAGLCADACGRRNATGCTRCRTCLDRCARTNKARRRVISLTKTQP